jgi:hypothetical protein
MHNASVSTLIICTYASSVSPPMLSYIHIMYAPLRIVSLAFGQAYHLDITSRVVCNAAVTTDSLEGCARIYAPSHHRSCAILCCT